MLASSFILTVFFVSIGCSLFFVVSLQFKNPVVKEKRFRRLKSQKPKTKNVKNRKRKRKSQASTKKEIQQVVREPPPKKIQPEISEKRQVEPKINKKPDPVAMEIETPELPPKSKPVKSKKLSHVPPIVIPEVTPPLPSKKTDNKKEKEDFEFLIEKSPSPKTKRNTEFDKRSISEPVLVSNAQGRRPPIVYNAMYKDKSMRDPIQKNREKTAHSTENKTSAYEIDSVMNQSPSPPGGDSTSGGSDSAKTTESYGESEGSATSVTMSPAPVEVKERIQRTPPSNVSNHNSQSNSVKRSNSSRSLQNHRHHYNHNYSKSKSQPSSPLPGYNHQHTPPNRHSNNFRRGKASRRKSKKSRPNRSHSMTHLNHRDQYYDPGNFPPQTPPLMQNRQMNFPMPQIQIPNQHFIPNQMPVFQHPVLPYGQQFGEMDNVLHPLQVKTDGLVDPAMVQFMNTQQVYIPQTLQQVPVQSPFGATPFIISHQPLPMSPGPMQQQMVYQVGLSPQQQFYEGEPH